MYGHTILLVDDEKEFVQTLAERLKLRGLKVDVAYDGPGALDSVSRRKPDVVVLDLYMPGMTGDVVLHSIKSRYPDLPVILLTGHCVEDDTGTGPQDSAFACLTKPLALSVLLETLKAALGCAAGDVERLAEGAPAPATGSAVGAVSEPEAVSTDAALTGNAPRGDGHDQ